MDEELLNGRQTCLKILQVSQTFFSKDIDGNEKEKNMIRKVSKLLIYNIIF